MYDVDVDAALSRNQPFLLYATRTPTPHNHHASTRRSHASVSITKHASSSSSRSSFALFTRARREHRSPARTDTEEFAARGERRAFEGYQLQDQGEFMQQISQQCGVFEQQEMDECLNVARMAGIQVDEKKKRAEMNRFDGTVVDDDDDDDDLNLFVQWDD